jgi:hypothetical protein
MSDKLELSEAGPDDFDQAARLNFETILVPPS